MTIQRFDRRIKYTVLQTVSRARLDDAWVLLRNAEETRKPQRRVGAIYLAGYAVECALKARICREKQVDILDPQYFTHDLTLLVRHTTRFDSLKRNKSIEEAFKFVESEWNVAVRYRMPSIKAEVARKLFRKAKEVCQWLSAN